MLRISMYINKKQLFNQTGINVVDDDKISDC